MGIAVTVSYRGEADLEPALRAVRKAEAALTFWDRNSPLSQLNRTGFLKNPPRPLVDCLEKARELFVATDGHFDPTIHSYLEWLTSEYRAGRVPDEHLAERKRRLVDFSRVEISTTEISLPPEFTLSLNGLAQGYLTDIFAEAFQAKSALVNFGEFRVLGSDPWPVEVAGSTLALTRSLAVSSGSGQRLAATASANHLIDPATGKSPPPQEIFAIEADEAWLADGLATTVAVGGTIPIPYRNRAHRVNLS